MSCAGFSEPNGVLEDHLDRGAGSRARARRGFAGENVHANRAVSAVRRSRRRMEKLAIVLLPLPDSPTSATASPRWMRKATSSAATTLRRPRRVPGRVGLAEPLKIWEALLSRRIRRHFSPHRKRLCSVGEHCVPCHSDRVRIVKTDQRDHDPRYRNVRGPARPQLNDRTNHLTHVNLFSNLAPAPANLACLLA